MGINTTFINDRASTQTLRRTRIKEETDRMGLRFVLYPNLFFMQRT